LDNIIIDIINENIDIKNVDILGGEPLIIYHKILEILKKLTENNIRLTFTTNASLLTKKMIDELINT
jgi:organic radical activating enzyme